MRSTSIRARLLASIAAIQIAVGGVAICMVGEHERHQSYVAFDASLGEQAAVLRSLLEVPDEVGGTIVFHNEFTALPKGGRFLITDAKGARIAGSNDWQMPMPLAAGARTLIDLRLGGARYRALVLANFPIVDVDAGPSVGAPRLNMMYGAPVARVEAHIRRVETEAMLAGLLLLVGSTAISGWALTRGLRPLRRLAAGAERMDVGQWDLAELKESRRFSELRPLADALGGLIDRLRAAFVRERQFFGDAAHEMKSSVAIVRSTLQFALQKERSAAEYRTELQGALADTERLQDLVGGMLDLGRIESTAAIHARSGNSPAEAHAAAQRVIDQLRPLAVEREIQIAIDSDQQEAWVRMPEEDLLLVLGNLLENAILYSDTGRAVSIAIRSGTEVCEIKVSDQGCGVAASALPYIFDRFYRGDASRSRTTGGVGLGLSIAKALVVRSGGAISVKSEEGKGTEFLITLTKL